MSSLFPAANRKDRNNKSDESHGIFQYSQKLIQSYVHGIIPLSFGFSSKGIPCERRISKRTFPSLTGLFVNEKDNRHRFGALPYAFQRSSLIWRLVWIIAHSTAFVKSFSRCNPGNSTFPGLLYAIRELYQNDCHTNQTDIHSRSCF